jgi:hypothetical protein
LKGLRKHMKIMHTVINNSIFDSRKYVRALSLVLTSSAEFHVLRNCKLCCLTHRILTHNIKAADNLPEI